MRNKEHRMQVGRFQARNHCALLLAFFLAGVWGGFVSQRARAQDDPFAQPPAGKNPSDERIDFAVTVLPKEARRGETVKLTVTGTPRPGFHTYPLTQRASNSFQDEIGLSQVIFDNPPGLQPLWPVTET